MKKYILFVLSAALTFLTVNAQATLEVDPDVTEVTNNFNLTADGSYIKYEEPDIMKETGWMAGVSGEYTARFPQRLVLGLDGRLAFGQVDYESNGTGTIDNINDFLGEARATAGYDIYVENSRITPYSGFGYRFLMDQLGGNVSTTGAGGYDRESNYYYVPVGVKTLTSLDGDWFWGMTAEYDFFLKGNQKSELGQALTGIDTLENDQNDGYGLKGSIQIIKRSDRFNVLVEPFINYWNIDKSEVKAITFGGTPVGVVGYEPENNSTEIGLKIGLAY
jgi:hypothetical protein